MTFSRRVLDQGPMPEQPMRCAQAAWGCLRAWRSSVQKGRSPQPRESPPSREHHPSVPVHIHPSGCVPSVGERRWECRRGSGTLTAIRHWEFQPGGSREPKGSTALLLPLVVLPQKLPFNVIVPLAFASAFYLDIS